MDSNHFIKNGIARLGENEEFENDFKKVAAAAVANNPMLVENILKYLVFNNDTMTSSKMVPTVRLVNKSWLETTTTLLKKSVKPFIVLNLNEKNSLNASDKVKMDGKHLDKFVARFGSPNRLKISLLPFKLILTVGFLREENHQSLMDCLTNLGNELVDLKVLFPMDGGSMPFIFPQFDLPLLRKLSFVFSHQNFDTQHFDGNSFGNDKNGAWLLQFFMNAGNGIRELRIVPKEDKAMQIDKEFDLLQLPRSISALDIMLPTKSESLEVLLKNKLPNLKKLAIKYAYPHKLDNDLMFKVLDRFRKTLTSFRIEKPFIDYHPYSFFKHYSNKVFFKLPLMEKLEILQIHSNKFEIDSQNVSCLQTFLPKLKQIDLVNQKKKMLAKWVANSKFENVDVLVISLLDNGYGHDFFFQSIDLKMIEQFHISFPNVTQLTLTFHAEDLRCLEYVFKNMSQLKSLSIIIEENFQETSRHLLYSTLLGIPVRFMAALTENSNFVDSVGLECNMEKSLVNLTELMEFTLMTKINPNVGPAENGGRPYISDVLFHEGFFKMSKLRLLNFARSYQVSSKMVDLWKRQDRVILI